MIAQIDSQGKAERWWPAIQSPEPHNFTPLYTPQIRRDFRIAAEWALQQSAEEVRQRHLRDRDMSVGEWLAISWLDKSTYCQPIYQSPDEWLEKVRQWCDRHAGRTTSEHPPTPWDNETSVLAAIYRTLSKGEGNVFTSVHSSMIMGDC